MSVEIKFLTDRQKAVDMIDQMKDGDVAVIVVHTDDEDLKLRTVGEPCETMLLGLLEQGKILATLEDEEPA